MVKVHCIVLPDDLENECEKELPVKPSIGEEVHFQKGEGRDVLEDEWLEVKNIRHRSSENSHCDIQAFF